MPQLLIELTFFKLVSDYNYEGGYSFRLFKNMTIGELWQGRFEFAIELSEPQTKKIFSSISLKHINERN